MGKSKSGGLARQPKDQKCQFLIGPMSSWFAPNATDIWTQPSRMGRRDCENEGVLQRESELKMECDDPSQDIDATLSYFVYGCIGCFCYGEIHHMSSEYNYNHEVDLSSDTSLSKHSNINNIGAIVNRLIDIKDDNSKVICARFLRQSPYPIVIILTLNGSLMIHDILSSENLVHYKKNDILYKILGLPDQESSYNGEQGAKRTKMGVTQQINSCAWPDKKNVFLGISLMREKNYFLLWLKLKDDMTSRSKNDCQISKESFIASHQKIDLDIRDITSPICLIESKMLTESICLLAVAMDNGLITVIVLDLDKGQVKRNIKLARHNDQLCSLSLFVDNTKKFSLGLLASVSRSGLLLVWDIENEFYFADYQVVTDTGNNHINWFALCFLTISDFKQIHIAVSSSDNSVKILNLPENTRSKIRLREIKTNNSGKQAMIKGAEPNTLKHNALMFNMEYDYATKTLISSSLDGNHLLWTAHKTQIGQNQTTIELKPECLIPSISDNSRTHMIRSSPIREDLVCFALGKAGVKFFKIADNIMESRFDMTASCSLVARKLLKANVSPTSIAWHPGHEYRLAIGTLDGKVFRADITPRKATLLEAEIDSPKQKVAKPVEHKQLDADDLFGVDYTPLQRNETERTGIGQKHFKTDGIYSLCWGPNPASPHDLSKYAIYAVGSISHRLSILYSNKDSSDKMTNYLDEFQDVSLPEALDQASEVAWKPSMDLMALGTVDGKIVIVSYLDDSHEDRSNHKLFEKKVIIDGSFGDKFIQCLAWHPTTDKDDQHYYYIASSSNESPAFVFNLKESMLVVDMKARLKLNKSVAPESLDGVSVLSAYVCKLEAHQKAITDIAWNPHDPDQLATVSFDRMCYVWSTENSFLHAKMLSKFAGRERLFTLEWSLVDDDMIFVSGHDGTIWAWRPSENVVRSNE